MGSRQVRLFHDHLLVKEPGTRQATPWHQDQPYYNVEGVQNCSMWLPVDPVDRASTVEFVAGSHRGPWLMPRSFMDDQAKWFPEGSLVELPDVEAHRDTFEILAWELAPGDAGLLPHAHAPRCGRDDETTARVLGAVPRRRRHARAARLADVARLPRAGGRAARRGADGPSALSRALATRLKAPTVSGRRATADKLTS
jgi:phytanoyl-CoA dioxygenase PhyH